MEGTLIFLDACRPNLCEYFYFKDFKTLLQDISEGISHLLCYRQCNMKRAICKYFNFKTCIKNELALSTVLSLCHLYCFADISTEVSKDSVKGLITPVVSAGRRKSGTFAKFTQNKLTDFLERRHFKTNLPEK